MTTMNILAIIPARGGSKGIPGKNIRLFGGKPLIGHSIDAAKGAPSVSRIMVNTEDEEIAKVAKELGAEVPFLRPQELAGDSSKIIDAVVHMLAKLKADEGYEPTHVLLLQPTSPMRTSEDIENAVALMKKRNANNVISICRTENVLMTKDAEDKIVMLNADQATGIRQELPKYYKFDGCMIYLIETKVLIADHSFAGGTPVGYEIDRWRSIDLDYPQDFVMGEIVFNHRKEIEERIKNFS